ncbi:MAG TPA: phosphoserine phosphatase SerB [Alphaproteobacteria bacterium]|nr:phosphoserine phosphatase SerB [Alphaproteobacteria bacterium]HNS45425.1 phosphoserine phosphatase SerB [Alphaproteobacteria bacterium]
MKTHLVLAGDVQESALLEVERVFSVSVDEGRWLSPRRACEISIGDLDEGQLSDAREALSSLRVDVFAVPENSRRKKLLIADMDATIVTGETLDDLAALAGLGEEISKVTAAAMRGELDFERALKMRVSKLKGVSEDLLRQTFAEMRLSEGAEILVRTMRAAGAECVLVSGGFTFFTSRVADMCGFSAQHGNVLGIENGVLTGVVIPPILDKNAKLSFLESYAVNLEIDLSETVAIGDGANDLPMLLAAGLGVGYRPKNLVREQVKNSIIHSDLTSLLYMQGFDDDEIASYTKN